MTWPLLYSFTRMNDLMEVTERLARPRDVVIRISHRTTGGGRSILLDAADVAALRDALSAWLEAQEGSTDE